MDLLREERTNLGGNSDRIGEQVIDRRQARPGPMSPRGHLDRSGFAGKGPKSIALRVSRQVDQNVDLVGLDAIRQPVIGPFRNVSPARGLFSEGFGDGVLGGSAGITNDLELRLVVILQHGPERERGRMFSEVAET